MTLTVDGHVLREGTPEYEWWKYQQAEKRLDLTTQRGFARAVRSFNNPAPLDDRAAPQHHPLSSVERQAAHPATFHGQVVRLCHASLADAGRMHYSEDYHLRQGLFRRHEARFLGASADCSQFGASIAHWLGNTKVTSTDFTGTLWLKGRQVAAPRCGIGAIFGAYPGVHFGWVTTPTGSGDWYVVGFGWQGAPDRSILSGLKAYFAQRGHPGVRFIDFA